MVRGADIFTRAGLWVGTAPPTPDPGRKDGNVMHTRNIQKINPQKGEDVLPRHTVLHLAKQIQRAGFTIMRIVTIVAATLFTSGGLIAAESAQAAITQYELNIPRQPLDTALTDLAQQTGLQVGRFSDAVKGDTLVGPVTGNYSADQALKSLLAATRLTYRTLNERAIIVLRPEDVAQLPPANTLSRSGGNEDPSSRRDGQGQGGQRGEDSSQTNDHKSFWSRLRLAQTIPGSAQSTTSVNSSSSSNRSGVEQTSLQTPVQLEEVLVTAQKRGDERLQDVPVPVTAISAATLASENQTRLQDYFTRVPGLSVTPDDELGSAKVAIRGITTGSYASPTVGIEVDDVPFGSSSIGAWGSVAPDVDPFDLARVEVLRGPQGTLYGAGSMGGLIKFVTVDPSTDGLSGRLGAGTTSVYNGSGLGYSVHGAINVPLTDTLAVRASGYTRTDPGYIDNPVLHLDGVNRTKAQGGMLSGLWKPSGDLSLRVSAVLQDHDRNGSNDVYVEPGLTGLQQSALLGTGEVDNRIQAYNANLQAKIGVVNLTSITAYNVSDLTYKRDETYDIGGLVQLLPNLDAAAAEGLGNIQTKKFTQETRLSAAFGPYFEGLVGAFYTYENSRQNVNIIARDPATIQDLGLAYGTDNPSTYTETAAFVNLTAHITQRFDIQIGGRESAVRNKVLETDIGPLVPLLDGSTSPDVFPRADHKATAFTYMLTPRFKVSDDLMVYARAASGYRPGHSNNGPANENLPPGVGPDRTENFEVGAKGELLDRTLGFDASLYRINWKDIQYLSFDANTGIGFLANGNRAKSQGFELSLDAKPLKGLTLSSWVSLNEATLTEPFPPSAFVNVKSGDRLPYSSRFSGSISADQQFGFRGGVIGYVGGSLSYVGERLGDFPNIFSPPARQALPAFAQTDLRTGVEYNGWSAKLFVNNVADKRGLLRGGIGTVYPFAFNYIQPRTVGLSVEKAF